MISMWSRLTRPALSPSYPCALQRKAKVEGLIDEVMSHLKVKEADYFGLYYAFKEQRVGVSAGAGMAGWCLWWCTVECYINDIKRVNLLKRPD